MTNINENISENEDQSSKPMNPAQRRKYIQELKAKKTAEEKQDLKRKKEEIKEAKKRARAEKGGLGSKSKVIIIAAILVILLIGGGIYMYLQNPDVFNSEETEEVMSVDVRNDIDTISDIIEPVEEPIAEPEVEPGTPVVKSKGDLPSNSWIVSFGSFKNESYASKNVQKLKEKNYKCGKFWIPDYFPRGAQFHKVYIGPYFDKAEAKALLPQIHTMSPNAYLIHVK